MTQFDPVQKPKHYNKGGVECQDAIDSAVADLTGSEAVCTGNAIKYLWRWKDKGGKQDLAKARWYLNRMLGDNGNPEAEARVLVLQEQIAQDIEAKLAAAPDEVERIAKECLSEADARIEELEKDVARLREMLSECHKKNGELAFENSAHRGGKDMGWYNKLMDEMNTLRAENHKLRHQDCPELRAYRAACSSITQLIEASRSGGHADWHGGREAGLREALKEIDRALKSGGN